MDKKIHKCPQCGGMRFAVTAHVAQDWEVDQNGEFIAVINSCNEVDHKPDDADIWQCLTCGFDAAGEEFLCEAAEDDLDDVQKAEKAAAEAMHRLQTKYGQFITVGINILDDGFDEDAGKEEIYFECSGTRLEDKPNFETVEEAENFLDGYLDTITRFS